jgi:UDP-glucose 6-dehydrogenase
VQKFWVLAYSLLHTFVASISPTSSSSSTFSSTLHTPAAAVMMQTSNNKRIKTSNDDSRDINATQTTRLVVPTFTSKNNTEELDLRFMTEEELKMLQKIGEQTRLVVVAFSSLVSDDPLSQSCSLL